ncbi:MULTISPECIES: hypothetical protein [unclassified Bacteroides]|jgi:hypothetical protein|uniref:hypothetical protein n=1 Tax=unclassified Bacteroides TaxID=2646097 RepID=UPI000E909B96|nr:MULTISPECIES: hypothetical protein [unclassified Bacteroides]RGN43835.1 hypothetical protein DXB63_15370 [Bacteroides sp. OM05-12]RHR73816.1 hypothetical protein DWW69_14225 [Bacteroides sp. AF16-49]DAO79075.1 MAG TPA: tail tape measure protein [Phycodnaviridae sp.]
MGKSKLSEDHINWILSLDASNADKEIHKLTVRNNELKQSNKEISKSLREVEIRLGKDSKEYKNLSAELNKNNNKLVKNREALKRLENQQDVNALSMTSLKRRAQDLQKQLDNTSKSIHPETYAKLDTELNKVKSRMGELKQQGDQINISMKNVVKGGIAALIGNMITKVVNWGGELLNKAKEFINESIDMAAKADGVQKAFKSLDDPGLLSNLRKSTKGTVNDLELMKAAVQAKDFRIPLQDLGKYLQFAQLKAQQTGQSVEYMTQSIVTGLGRKSVMILDNLGLSAAEINEQVAKTGDFMAAVATIVDKQLAAAGDSYVSAADRMQQRTVLLENAKLKLGNRLSWLHDKYIDFTSKVLKGAISMMDTATEKYEEQREKTVSLAATLPDLVSQYNELKSKSKLSKEEQEKLNSIIVSITSSVPGAAMAFDSYGNAIEISTDKVNEFIKSQKALFIYQHQNAIAETEENLKKYRKEYENLLAIYKQGGKAVWRSNGMFQPLTMTIDKSSLKEVKADIEKYGALIKGAELELERLKGDSLEKAIKENQQRSEMQKQFIKMNKVQLDAWLKDEKNAASQYRELAQQIRDSKTETSNDKSDPNQVALKNMDSAHAEELNKIRLHGQEKQKTESEINIEILQSDRNFYAKRIIELEKFKKKEKKSSKRAEYEKQIVESKTKLLNTEVSLEKEAVAAISKTRQDDLKKEEAVSKAQQIILTQKLANQDITQEQHDALMLSLNMASAEMRLAIEERYLNDVNDLELKNGQIKVDAVQQANNAVIIAEQNAANSRAALQTKMNDLVKDFKNQFKLTTVDEDLQMQLKVLEASYQARKNLAEKENLDTTELDAAYYRAKEQIIQDSENRINQIRNQYGLLNQQEQYNLELQQLKDHLAAEELTQEEYEEAVQNLKIKSAKQQFDYYSNLMGGAVQALQQAEMDNIDAKYDVEIEAAKGNAEEVERLENEKAQKKLDVQKKYADVNFAIEVSQIMANTAVAIMQAFAQLGPIGGAVAAALMTVTGAAQVASANAERKKVKNMTLSGSSSSGRETGTRVATGREKGGKVDVTRAQDGKLFPDAEYDPDARGFIDRPTVIVGEGPAGRSKEWVASNAAVNNPTIAPFLQLLDAHQQAGDISTIDLNQIMRQRMAAGYASGGSISTPVAIPAGNTTNSNVGESAVIAELLALLSFLKENGIPAYVVLSELEKKQNLRDRSRIIGSKS